MPATPSFLTLGSVLVGRCVYRLNAMLGRGAFGAVYRASVEEKRDGVDIPAEVAIKIIGMRRRFTARESIAREASALASIDHPRIPRLYEWWNENEYAVLVSHLYPGGSLSKLLADRVRLDTNSAWRLLGDLLAGLVAAHRKGLLHLDIKPANVLHDGKGGYILADFGISQASRVQRGAAVTPSIGTRGYNAPEQRDLDLDRMDVRTDLWGVGATAWALYSGLDLSTIHRDLRDKEQDRNLPRLTDVRADADPALDDFVMSLLKPDPADRPGGAAAALTIWEARDSGETPLPHHGIPLSVRDTERIIHTVADPLWGDVLRNSPMNGRLRLFTDGEYLCREGETSFECYAILAGCVAVERHGDLIATESREGSMIGEVATLTGSHRTASLRAAGDLVALCLNQAELEDLVVRHGPLGLRLAKTMAERFLERDCT
ncbi:MAG: eukaryotic-like serine/threonine-protein kinase [Candidatus Sumerlaeota bacterium]|nr:eukaryotic-like serine/threonine-protein kinase [Candidatus Sumerlaeota bacterium]